MKTCKETADEEENGVKYSTVKRVFIIFIHRCRICVILWIFNMSQEKKKEVIIVT